MRRCTFCRDIWTAGEIDTENSVFRGIKINFALAGEGETAEFYVLEQTRIAGNSYLLVTETEDEDGNAWILKDLSADGEADALYEIVEDDGELEAVSRVFEEMLEDEQAIILAEWPDPIARMLPADRLEMNFILQKGDERTLELKSFGRVSDRLLEGLCQHV